MILKKRITIHFIVWAIFITYEISVSLTLGSGKNLLEFIPYYFLHIALFYFYAHIILDYFGKKPYRWWIVPPLTTFTIAIHLGLSLYIQHLLFIIDLTEVDLVLNVQTIVGSLWRGVYFVLLSTTYWLLFYLLNKNEALRNLELRSINAEKERYQLKNAYLTAQINQHLLFNIFNFIYNSVRKASPVAAESILVLSNIMRHSLQGTDEEGLIKIDNEIDHIIQLLRITRLRFGDQVFIEAEMINENPELKIPPLILVTFVENMLKHGDLTEEHEPCQIYLKVDKDKIFFKGKNLKKNTNLPYSHKSGIKNTKYRIDTYFGSNKYKLDIEDGKENYILTLVIDL
uniref:Signal transduction histidine kinase, LytS n=1 Tax=Sphingobacterium sp. (strain 21) TaxID=743722 RepID=F4CBI1_SPHS2